MLFRQVRAEGSWPFAHDLHPRVTVMTGLGTDRQAELADMVHDALYGRGTRLQGTIDLNGEDVDLADWASQVGDTLDRVELLIRSSDLPAPADEDLGDDVARAERGVADARHRLDAATEAVARARSAMARVSAKRDAGGEAGAATDTGQDETAIAHAERRLADADAALAAAMHALSRWDGDGSGPYDQDADGGFDRSDAADLRGALEAARRELAELEARHHGAMEALDAARKPDGPPETAGPDPGLVAKVRQAVADVQAQLTLPRSPVISRLLDEHTNLVDRRGRLGPSPSQWMVDLAKTALDEARQQLTDAEAMLPPSALLTPDDIAEIERLHHEATEAAERADRRFVSPVAKRRLAAAMAAERETLSRLGFATYGAYLLRAVGQGDAEVFERVERARVALADAEAVWDELQAREEVGDEGTLRADERQFLAEAATVLQRPEIEHADLRGAAAALEGQARDDQRVLDERMLALRGLLADAEVEVEGADPISAAESWLESQGHREDARRTAAASVSELERAVTDLEREWDAQVDRVDGLERDLARAEGTARRMDRGQLEQAVRDAEREVATRAAAVEAARGGDGRSGNNGTSGEAGDDERAARILEDAEATMAEEAARYAEASDRLIAARAVRTTVMRSAEPSRVVDAEIYVLARLAAVRSVGTFGSMPLVLVEPFGDLPAGDVGRVLGTLGRMSEVIQILVISDRPDVVSWAEGLGEERAAVCRFDVGEDPPAA